MPLATKRFAPPRICISATGQTPAELLQRARQALRHSRFVELRLDWVSHPQQVFSLIPQLLETSSAGPKAPVLQATCRRRQNGGRFAGTVSEQMGILQRAAQLGCRLLDLEIESAEKAGPQAVEALRRQALLILSFHDFERTPPLQHIARRLVRFPADFYKLVPTATRQSDNCVVLDFLREAAQQRDPDGKWIGFCMGEAGTPSRVLALSRGSAFIYAAPPTIAENSSAAPGQLACDTLRDLYRVEKLSPHSALYGLLGWPVRHSVGAAVHNAAFRARRLDAVYLPLLASRLDDFRKAAQSYPLAGFSVTIPHKERILRFVDRADRRVKMTGAANTVRVRGGRWEATNTDVEGLLTPLQKAFRLQEGESLNDFRAVVVGAGGAARAAIAALRLLRCHAIFVTGRNSSKVRALAQEMGARPLPLMTLFQERFDLLIHATSVGMWPRTDECLLEPEQLNARVVFDLVYNPVETLLLEQARARGCRTISGLEMFVAQAARQFEYWTGLEPPLRQMRRVAERELARFQQTCDPPPPD